MRAYCVAAALLLVLASGCGEAAWNPDLKTAAPIDRGTPFVDVLALHGCPDSVQEIDSETFTATWEQVRLVALAPFYTKPTGASVAVLVRKGKVSGQRPSEGSSVLRVRPTAGLLPLLAVFAAWLLGRALRERARVARRPLAVLSALLLVATFGTEKTGVAVSGGGAAEGSPVGTLVDELGAPSSVLRLPGDAGSLLVYRTFERKKAVIGGTEVASTQAFLVQRGKVTARSAKTTTLQAQFYLAQFHGGDMPGFELAWSAALALLALAIATRRPRGAGIESPPPTA